jgi:hypothetical protein
LGPVGSWCGAAAAAAAAASLDAAICSMCGHICMQAGWPLASSCRVQLSQLDATCWHAALELPRSKNRKRMCHMHLLLLCKQC